MKRSTFKDGAGKLILLLIFTFLLPIEADADVKVKQTTAGYRDERQFYRISEFFTKREKSGGDLVLRTREKPRGGYYFTIRLSSYPYRSETVEEAVQLQVIMPGEIEPTLFTFPLGPAKRRNPLLLIGLTGEDWPDPDAAPLAWKISFHDSEGNLLTETQSFLWSIED